MSSDTSSFRNRFTQRQSVDKTINENVKTTGKRSDVNIDIGTPRTKKSRKSYVIVFFLIIIGGCIHLISYKHDSLTNSTAVTVLQRNEEDVKETKDEVTEQPSTKEFNRCHFRTYMSHRFYGLNRPSSEQPSFLMNNQEAIYINGKWPTILPSDYTDPYHKICIDQTEWDNDHPDNWPFGDGQNPSIASLASSPYGQSSSSSEETPSRLDYSKNAKPLKEFISAQKSHIDVNDLFLGVTVFGNAKCAWNMTVPDKIEYKYSTRDINSKPVEQTMILILNENFETIHQSILVLEQDADWGTARKKIQKKTFGDGMFIRSTQQMDDARIFFHDGNPYVLYRNGPKFGYDKQIQNPLHFDIQTILNKKRLVAYVKASETFTICCGRNIALISEEFDEPENNNLKALTWIDPVTIDAVNLIGKDMKRRLVEEGNDFLQISQYNNVLPTIDRNLRQKTKIQKSNIHGTNGYMIPLKSTRELLGIAHFHRPENRQKSDYALHGHHYTHAFFTLSKEPNLDSETNNKNHGYVLKRISNEFLFPTQSTSTLEDGKADGDMIQFASGIDLIGSDKDGKLIISYGINDCEGAVFSMGMDKVQAMLINLDRNSEKEVIDIMRPFEA